MDGKIGHEKQSQALIEGLKTVHTVNSIEIKVTGSEFRYIKQWLLGQTIGPDQAAISSASLLTRPDLIIGAGHKTHLPMVLAKWQTKAKLIAIMSPSLPKSLFDLIIAPKHDYANQVISANTLTTLTALAPSITSNPNKQEGLILLGGESRHFQWDNTHIKTSIEKIVTCHPQEMQWSISTSGRTPLTLLKEIEDLAQQYTSVHIYNYKNLSSDWLATQLTTAGFIWVSADSASMLAEALNTKAQIGVIMLPPAQKGSKLAFSIAEIKKTLSIITSDNIYQSTNDNLQREPLNEHVRCAQHISNRFIKDKTSP